MPDVIVGIVLEQPQMLLVVDTGLVPRIARQMADAPSVAEMCISDRSHAAAAHPTTDGLYLLTAPADLPDLTASQTVSYTQLAPDCRV